MSKTENKNLRIRKMCYVSLMWTWQQIVFVFESGPLHLTPILQSLNSLSYALAIWVWHAEDGLQGLGYITHSTIDYG